MPSIIEDDQNKEFQYSSKKTLGWVPLRDKKAHSSELKVPVRSSFNQKLESEQNFSYANVGYLPPITFPSSTNERELLRLIVINRTLSIKKELGLSYIFLEVYQAVYAKTLGVMFKLKTENKNIFDKIIVRMGGFHIIICLFLTIYCCFRNTGLV